MEAVIIEQSAGITVVNGRPYMNDAKGNLVPAENVRAEDKLQDETVRKIMGFARDLSAQIARFRSHTVADLGSFDSLLEQEYGTKIGGQKGNRTYQTIDGRQKVQVQVSDQISFGPQLQTAKTLIDECIMEWSEGSRDEIRALVMRAFNTEKEGQINKSDLFMLLRLDIRDQRWLSAMDAIRNSITVTGSKEYVRFYERDTPKDEWRPITIDLAKA
ncbi:DUF3164 family protein [Rhizobium leguminosarum]|uniref:DUF3164 family protein n=1 Tax=Rhizobium leguminosarum TaxID=384 RepID=UPI001C9137A2|nr:DUF3164 family protein [Rhizobium leguminosarum]MBY2950484.1 DUF3164 family protein [Rhizobium leguminosarum]